MRRTKIVCTLGPPSSDIETIGRLIDAGMDVARMNFSHSTHDDHRIVIDRVRTVAADRGIVVPILQDLQGPKIRIGDVKHGGVLLHEDAEFVLTSEPMAIGKAKRVHINHPAIGNDAEVGGRILLDDGLIELEVVAKRSTERSPTGEGAMSSKGSSLPITACIAFSRPPLTVNPDREGFGSTVARICDFTSAFVHRGNRAITRAHTPVT